MSEQLMRLQAWARTVEQPPEVCSEEMVSRLACLRRHRRTQAPALSPLDAEPVQPKHRRKRKPLPPPVYDD